MRNVHAIILAGGAGTRLWPLSRKNRPKQLLKLIDGQSLLQHAVERLTGLFPIERIWVVTHAELVDAIHDDLPDLPGCNMIVEPAMRDTANAIGLAAHLLHARDSKARMLITTADHLIGPNDQFHTAIRRAANAIDRFPNALVTFGVIPTQPHTGYGYLQLGESVGDGLARVDAFYEKPDLATAERYVADGAFRWNSGMFAWRASTLLSELKRWLPENNQQLERITSLWEQSDARKNMAELYERLPRISIDYGVMEKAGDVLAIDLPCSWRDVGSWDVVAALQPETAQGNAAIGAQIIELDAANNLMVADDDHLIAALGVDNLVIVKTHDATFICNRDHLHRVRELVDACRAKYGSRYD